MSTFEFREEDHSYWLDGQRLPSVTEILRPLKDFSAVPSHILQAACDYGTAVHKMVEIYIEGDLHEEALDPGLVGPLRAFKGWQQEHSHLVNPVVERPMCHPRLGFAGTPDLIYDGIVVVDLKTRPADRNTDSLQCAAYQELWEANGGLKGKYEHRVLELKQSGDYVYTRVNDPQAHGMFRDLLAYHRIGNTIEAWRGRK